MRCVKRAFGKVVSCVMSLVLAVGLMPLPAYADFASGAAQSFGAAADEEGSRHDSARRP